MKSFNELIVEDTVKKSDPYRLVVIAERPKKVAKKSTSTKMVSVGEAMGLEVYSVRINGAYLDRDEDTGVIFIHNEDDEKGFEIDADTLVMIRGGVTKKDSYLDLISQIERYGVATCNPRECIEVCSDKFRTYLRLQEIGLNQPKTVLIPNDDKETVDRAHEALDNDFPMVLKTLQGSKGVGVLLIETERSLQSQVSLIYKIDPYCDILLQEYIESDYDVRVIIVNREIVGAMRRNKITDDFRSNVSQGAEAEEVKLTELEMDVCLRAAKVVNGQWVGVDFIPAKNRKTEPPYLLEVNHSPGTEGISSVIGEDMVKKVLKIYRDRDLWKKTPTECGVLETIEVEGQEMTIKMYTGNSVSACSLHADNLVISSKNGKKSVQWETDGVKYNKPLIREVQLTKPAETRPVVELELNFLNTIYEQEVSLDSRGLIPFLANRDLMQRANLMINPARKFMITNKRDEKDDS